MSLETQSDMTGMMSGMPKRKTHRRGNRGHGKSPIGDPHEHHANIKKALDAGDHAAAKTHAFALVRSLHAKTAEEQQDAPTNEPNERESMGGNWIAGAIKHKGALHESLGVPQGQKIPAKKIARAATSDNPTLARRARLAQTLKKLNAGKK